LIESEFIFEVVDPASGAPLAPGQRGELVITNLGRPGMPLIRYRTGDAVELDGSPCPCGRTFARLPDGILGRVDEMIVVRGMNVYPSAIEGVIREFPEVAEFRIEVRRVRQMAELRLLVEPVPECASEDQRAALVNRVCDTLHNRLLLRVPCEAVAPNTLPRFEMKARRVVFS
jgi:phenylacetate-CoA ligase